MIVSFLLLLHFISCISLASLGKENTRRVRMKMQLQNTPERCGGEGVHVVIRHFNKKRLQRNV